MRLRLSVLTPPANERGTFADWLAQLKGTEDAALTGDAATIQADDLYAQRDATALGLADACIYHP